MKFQPSFLLKNRHIQTVYASLFRKAIDLDIQTEEFELSDGDFVDVYWHKCQNPTPHSPIIILFHGLTGSYKSPYIQGMMQAAHRADFNAVLMHFRGCSGRDNRMPRSYHSGDTQDAREFIESLKKRYPKAKLFGVGYSLGANMLLKFLGEEKKSAPLDAAVAVSAPMLLDRCADKMNRGFSRFYQHLLLKDLHIALEKKYEKHPMQKLINLPKEKIKNLKSFWEFDEAYTAKINGFASAQDYYTKCSAKQYLKNIEKRTLIIHAKDDPFMTQEVIPSKEEISKKIELQILDHGGHVGFVEGTLLRPHYWLEDRIISFFQSS